MVHRLCCLSCSYPARSLPCLLLEKTLCFAGLGSTMGTATAGAVDSTATGYGGNENTQANTDAAERGDKAE